MEIVTSAKDTNEDGLPAPRRAAEELPTLERTHELGIEVLDLETARAVACLLSRYLARGRSKGRSNLKAMMIALATASSIEVVHDGEAEPAPHPELEAVIWPNASVAFRRLGVTAAALDAYWREARNRSSDACFPIEWLVAFFPVALWPAVATAISWGPERTGCDSSRRRWRLRNARPSRSGGAGRRARRSPTRRSTPG